MRRSTAVDAVVSAIAILLISGLAVGWFSVAHATDTPATPVTDAPIDVGAGIHVHLRGPSGWDRVPTGQRDVVRFVKPGVSTLTVRTTTGVTDFQVAAPRRLRELEIGGVDARFTGNVAGPVFRGRGCVASAPERSGVCAVVGHGDVIVTVVALRRGATSSPDDAAAVHAVVDSLRPS